jgi:ribose transport system permease protein
MTTTEVVRPARSPWLAVRRLLRDQPVIPLTALLVGLVILQLALQPTLDLPAWTANTVRVAIPLAILAACQTLTMLTGGIDLSAAYVASMAAYLMATQAFAQGDVTAIALGIAAAALVGLINGLGVGIFRVNPLIMTIGMGLVVFGFVTVYQLETISNIPKIPGIIVELASTYSFRYLPNSVFLFVPLVGIIFLGLKRTGYGRLLYAVGDNEHAARLSGVRVWQVLVVVYLISSLLAAVAGMMWAGSTRTATINLVDPFLLSSVAAAVIGGTSIFGGRGGYAGTILGALILTVLNTSILVLLDVPNAMRTVLFGAIVLAVAAAYTRITEEG